MIDCLLFRAAGVSFYRGRIQDKSIMAMGLHQLSTQQLHNLQKIKRKSLDGFIMLDGRLQLSDGSDFILVSDGLELYEPIKLLAIRDTLSIFLDIVSCYLRIKYAIWGRVSINDGAKQAGLYLSQECLVVGRNGKVKVCDLGGIQGKYALKEDVTSVRRIWRYLSKGSQMEQSREHRRVYQEIGGFGCLQELEKWVQKTIESYRSGIETQTYYLSRLSLKNSMMRENQPPCNISVASSRRRLKLAKNSSQQSPVSKKIKGPRPNRLILSQFLRSDQDLVENEVQLQVSPNRQQRSYLKKRNSNSIRNMTLQNQVPLIQNQISRERQLNKVVNQERKLTLGTGRRLKDSSFRNLNAQEIRNSQPQEASQTNEGNKKEESIHLEDIVIDRLESAYEPQELKRKKTGVDESTSKTSDAVKKEQQEHRQTAETQQTEHNNIAQTEHQQPSQEHEVTEPRTSSSSISSITPCLLYSTLFQRYDVIVEAVSEVSQSFRKVEVGCRPALFLLYKKYLHIRMCLSDCLKSGDNPLELPQWDQLRDQSEYRMLIQQIDQENQELLKSCVKMRQQLKCNLTKEEEPVYDVAKAGHAFDRNMLQRNQNLYNRLKQRAIGIKCRATLQLVCRYVRALLISFEWEMELPPNLEASLGAFNAFLTESQRQLEQLYQKMCPIES